VDQSWGVQERILVCITPGSNAAQMLESGRRNADRFQGEFYVVYVQQSKLPQEKRAILQQNLDYANQLGAQVEVLNDLNATDAILKFARQKGITQIFIGRNTGEGKWPRLWRNPIERLILATEGIDVIVYPH
jgi:two-component system sensor histidine kinase KdpD